MKPPVDPLSSECRTISETLSRIGDKWSVLVVAHLGDGPMRFSELQRAIGGISQKMLTTTLRGLERDGYLSRTVTPSIPPRVDYALTGLGRELLEPIRALESFARRNQARIAAARAVFDAPEAAIGGKPQAAGARQARSRF
jgi:DNA-binding HxlR family transcriptional regulator